jgi:hypothetical protein
VETAPHRSVPALFSPPFCTQQNIRLGQIAVLEVA